MDTLSLYLKQIQSYQRLTKDEEKSLSKAIKKGHEASQSSCHSDEVMQLIRDGQKAYERMIEGNYLLVVFIAKNYKDYGLPFIDVIQEGNLGLIEAVKRFDGDRGVTFATFAAPYIKQSITRALSSQVRMIRIPEYKLTQMRKYRKQKEALKNQKNDINSPKDVYSDSEIKEMESLEKCKIVSLDYIYTDAKGKKVSYLESVVDENDNPHEYMMNEDNEDRFYNALASLDIKQKQVLFLRWGLNGEKEMSYEKISNTLMMSKEGVRKIEKKALNTLKIRLLENM